jgi:hypothetical protein
MKTLLERLIKLTGQVKIAEAVVGLRHHLAKRQTRR